MGAQRMMRRLSSLNEVVATWRGLEADAGTLAELVALSIEEDDQELAESLAGEAERIVARLEEVEFQVTLSGPYDDGDAILAVHAGAGGAESQDWAEMLLRMYLRWAEKRGFRTRLLDTSLGEEAGIKSATAEVSGSYVNGWLKAERGVHRLVRLSPYNAAHLRHTSFALVEVWPDAGDDQDVTINEEDLRVDTFRSGGHGGQNVQKVGDGGAHCAQADGDRGLVPKRAVSAAEPGDGDEDPSARGCWTWRRSGGRRSRRG